MTNRGRRVEIANETIGLLQRETYSVDSHAVSLAAALETMRAGTVLYTPADVESLAGRDFVNNGRCTKIRVLNCDTLSAAKALIDSGFADPLCLNFGSAKHPGGGFKKGSDAQEESLVRATGLYASLLTQPTYYEANRHCGSSLYTHHVIYSPSVPAFRAADSKLLEDPFTVSIITAPAVNATAVTEKEPSQRSQIAQVMAERIEAVLGVALSHGHDSIVLGAWGCGVFGNDPADMAHWFANALVGDTRFSGAFDTVVFAVLDSSANAPTFSAFRERFSESGT